MQRARATRLVQVLYLCDVATDNQKSSHGSDTTLCGQMLCGFTLIFACSARWGGSGRSSQGELWGTFELVTWHIWTGIACWDECTLQISRISSVTSFGDDTIRLLTSVSTHKIWDLQRECLNAPRFVERKKEREDMRKKGSHWRIRLWSGFLSGYWLVVDCLTDSSLDLTVSFFLFGPFQLTKTSWNQSLNYI